MSIKVAIGGIGGSGTRIVAKVIEELEYFIGHDLNRPLDNLLFTLFFKRQNVLTLSTDEFKTLWELFKKLMSHSPTLSNYELEKLKSLAQKDRLGHDSKWLNTRVNKIKDYKGYPHTKWAWKEPNTHIVIEKLLEQEESLKFIYVYRNGLDMAHSNNQNQLKLWGPIFFNDFNLQISPRNSLKYWCLTHRRMLSLKEKYPNRILLLEFESLCIDPIKKINEIENFSETKIVNEKLESLLSLIALPSSVNRYKNYSLDEYDKEDIEFVKSIYSNI